MNIDDAIEAAMAAEDKAIDDLQVQALTILSKKRGADSRIADAVAPRVLAGRYRYSPTIGWFAWDGRRWDHGEAVLDQLIYDVRLFVDKVECELRGQSREAKRASEQIEAAVIARTPPEQQFRPRTRVRLSPSVLVGQFGTDQEKDDYAHATTARMELMDQADAWLNALAASQLSAVTKLCRGMPGILTRITEFDSHHHLLNCHNCVVDLRDGSALAHDPDMLITHLAGGEYHPDAASPLWTKALEAVHPEAREWVQTRMGQSTTGHTPDDDALIFSHGAGENGKTTFFEGIMRALGTYGDVISHRVLLTQPGQHPTELTDLRGLRLAVLEETPEHGKLDTHQVKRISQPKIVARRMRENDMVFDTTHSLWISSNHQPIVETTDHGSWRRLKKLPWPYKFRKPHEAIGDPDVDRRGDPALRPAVQADPTVPAAVIRYLVEGAVRWFASGRISPEDPDVVVAATLAWRQTSDAALRFAQQHLVECENRYITGPVMLAEFNGFLKVSGYTTWSSQQVTERLEEALRVGKIACQSTPRRPVKVRTGDEESRPDHSGDEVPIHAVQPVGEPVKSGSAVRIWRGMRFQTEKEMRATDRHLRTVNE